jgi:hypothetical protein
MGYRVLTSGSLVDIIVFFLALWGFGMLLFQYVKEDSRGEEMAFLAMYSRFLLYRGFFS